MRAWQVSVRWTGGDHDVASLYRELAHLDITTEVGEPIIHVAVTAPSAIDAERYVAGVLHRAELDGLATVVPSNPA